MTLVLADFRTAKLHTDQNLTIAGEICSGLSENKITEVQDGVYFGFAGNVIEGRAVARELEKRGGFVLDVEDHPLKVKGVKRGITVNGIVLCRWGEWIISQELTKEWIEPIRATKIGTDFCVCEGAGVWEAFAMHRAQVAIPTIFRIVHTMYPSFVSEGYDTMELCDVVGFPWTNDVEFHEAIQKAIDRSARTYPSRPRS